MNKVTCIALLATSLIISSSIAATKDEPKIKSLDPKTLEMITIFGDVFEKIKNEYVVDVTDRELIESAINGMLTARDPHSGFLDSKALEDMKSMINSEFGGVGIVIVPDNGLIKVIAPYEGGPADKAGVKAGDYIVAVENEAVQGMKLDDVVLKLRGNAGTEVNLTVLRKDSNEFIDVKIKRDNIKLDFVKYKLLENNIAYVRLAQFSEKTAKELKDAIINLKKISNNELIGLILDLRNNPGGLLSSAIDVSDLFLDQGEIVSTKGKKEENQVTYSATKGDILNGLPVVVIVNNGSASASEIVAAALQDNKRAIILGTKTFGKASVQELSPIPQLNGAIKMTVARYYTPSGKSIQAEGVVPDLEVEEAKILYNTSKEKFKFSETSLKNHLEKDNGLLSKFTNKTTKNKEKAISVEANPDLVNDLQLNKAVDTIKVINLMNDSE